MKRALIDRNDGLPVTAQCELRGVPRSAVYYEPKQAAHNDLDLMRKVDENHLGRPFLGSRRIVDALADHRVQIGMDGCGRWMDNVFIERLSRSVKYEEVYLHAYETGTQARASLGDYFEFYNTKRHHQALDRRTPHDVYQQDHQLPQAA
jgi:hypothetical protein